ncbi:MAG: hypothetical protein ACREL9_05340 [Gemmatimonadales bacterium]
MLLHGPLLVLLFDAVALSGLDGTWDPARVFRSGGAPSAREIPPDSTTYGRVTLTTEPSGWIVGVVERRYRGQPERTRLPSTAAEGPGRYLLSYRLRLPVWARGATVAWMVGDTVRMGTALVPDADRLEFRRVRPEDPFPTTILEITTGQ